MKAKGLYTRTSTSSPHTRAHIGTLHNRINNASNHACAYFTSTHPAPFFVPFSYIYIYIFYSAGLNAQQPRTFGLQKMVEVVNCNIERIDVIWPAVAEHFLLSSEHKVNIHTDIQTHALNPHFGTCTACANLQTAAFLHTRQHLIYIIINKPPRGKGDTFS